MSQIKEIKIINKNKSFYSCLPESSNNYIKDNKMFFGGVSEGISNIPLGVEVKDYRTDKNKDLRGKPIIISYLANGFKKEDKFIVNIFNEDNSYQKEIVTNKRKIYLYNLIPHQEYFYQISSLDKSISSEIYSFTIIDDYRFIYSPHCLNTRDIGGKKTKDNKIVKYGLLYRGTELTRRKYHTPNDRDDHGDIHYQIIHKNDLSYLKELGIKVDLDLRSGRESGYPNKSPIEEFEYVRCSINGYQPFFKQGIELEEYRKLYRQIFDLFANADKKPVYVHCWGGADRTGTICFVLEALLGCKLSDLVIDYELTHINGNKVSMKPYDPDYSFIYHKYTNFFLTVEWLKEYQREDEDLSDLITRYLVSEIGIKKETIEKIKDIFLE